MVHHSIAGHKRCGFADVTPSAGPPDFFQKIMSIWPADSVGIPRGNDSTQ